MINDIKYSGYATQPSDYECSDGELSLSLNLLNEDGGIKSLCGPKEEISIIPGHEILLIHSVPGQKNYIILTGNRDGLFGLSWLKRDTISTTTETPSLSDLNHH